MTNTAAELVRAVLATHPVGAAAPVPHQLHGTLLHLGAVPLDTVHGRFVVHLCQNLFTLGHVLVLACGDVTTREAVLARVHSSCVTSESYGSCDCDCAEQLDGALAAIAAAGRGALFYLMQEGRGAGFAAKARDRMLVQASRNRITTFEAYARMGLGSDHRQYDEVAFARRLLGITAPLTLLTNNPDKIDALVRADVAIAGTVPLQHAASAFNLHYMAAKARSGHTFELSVGNDGPGAARVDELGRPIEAVPAEPPERVEAFTPYADPSTPHLVRMASYLLPILVRGHTGNGADGGPHWFRLDAYFDAAASVERVVLAYRARRDVTPLVCAHREVLLDRFSPVAGGDTKPSWHESVRTIVAHGAGIAVIVAGEVDASSGTLLARHVGAARVRPLIAAAEAWDDGGVLAAALARAGVAVDAPVAVPPHA